MLSPPPCFARRTQPLRGLRKVDSGVGHSSIFAHHGGLYDGHSARFWGHLVSPPLTYAPLDDADVLTSWPCGHNSHDNQNQEKQAMKLRIETSAVSFICTRSPEQRIAFDTVQPKVDRETGQPLRQVQQMALDASGADVIAVAVRGDPN